ncbi:MAG: hypothetical protein JWO87_1146 [Phycisphaerales bacterium]|nr:hypothetical protein [Phycisphaerales bacterium]
MNAKDDNVANAEKYAERVSLVGSASRTVFASHRNHGPQCGPYEMLTTPHEDSPFPLGISYLGVLGVLAFNPSPVPETRAKPSTPNPMRS